MDPKLVEALKQLRQAHQYITENWDEKLEVAYPYDQPFDEMTSDVSEWVRIAIGE